jgi:hypothetical protein
MIYEQAARAASKNPDYAKGLVVPVKGGSSLQLQIVNLTKGNWGCFADEDSSFPDSTESKRALLEKLVAMAAGNPVGEALMQSPDNWEAFLSINGMPELTIPQAEARNKQVRELELLLEQTPQMPKPQDVQQLQIQHATATLAAQQGAGPMPPPMPDIAALMQPDPMTGGPSIDNLLQLAQLGLLKPSIPIGPLDYNAFEGEYLKEWLSSISAWRAEAEGKQINLLNVLLHAQAHLAAAAQEAQAAAQQAAQAKVKESLDFKDLPPEGQVQEAAQAGIHIAPGQPQKDSQHPKAAPPGKPGSPSN